MKIDKSAEDDFIAIVIAQEVAKYKSIIEKLLPYAEHEIKMSTCIGYSYEKCKSIIEEAKQLIK